MAYAIACRVLGLRDLGPSLSPMNAFLVLTGIETLPLRMQTPLRQRARGRAMAAGASQGRLGELCRASKDNASYGLHRTYCPKGAGSVFTFGVKGGYEAGMKIVNSVQAVQPSRQCRRHAQPHHPSGLDDAPPARTTSSARRPAPATTSCASRSASKTSKTSSPIWIRRWRRKRELERVPDGGAEQQRRGELVQRRERNRAPATAASRCRARPGTAASAATTPCRVRRPCAPSFAARVYGTQSASATSEDDIGADAVIELRQARVLEEIDPPGRCEEWRLPETRARPSTARCCRSARHAAPRPARRAASGHRRAPTIAKAHSRSVSALRPPPRACGQGRRYSSAVHRIAPSRISATPR